MQNTSTQCTYHFQLHVVMWCIYGHTRGSGKDSIQESVVWQTGVVHRVSASIVQNLNHPSTDQRHHQPKRPQMNRVEFCIIQWNHKETKNFRLQEPFLALSTTLCLILLINRSKKNRKRVWELTKYIGQTWAGQTDQLPQTVFLSSN